MTRHLLALAPLALLSAASAPAQTLYATDFATLDGWTVTTGCATGYAWAADATPASRFCGTAPYRSAPASLNFNDGVDIGGPGAHGGAHISCGVVTSPPIDLGAAGSGATLGFWLSLDGEPGCEWDELRLTIRDAGTGALLSDACFDTPPSYACGWHRVERALDPLWGVVEIVFTFDTHDGWWNDHSGPFIDDLEVVGGCDGSWSLQCLGRPSVATSLPARLDVAGSVSVSQNDLELHGRDFPMNTFAAAFYGANTGTIFIGNGVRCIAAAQSFRLAIAPTRDLGAPRWTVDLATPPSAAGQILAGSTWFFQSIYRDGPSVNFSDAIEIRFCD